MAVHLVRGKYHNKSPRAGLIYRHEYHRIAKYSLWRVSRGNFRAVVRLPGVLCYTERRAARIVIGGIDVAAKRRYLLSSTESGRPSGGVNVGVYRPLFNIWSRKNCVQIGRAEIAYC